MDYNEKFDYDKVKDNFVTYRGGKGNKLSFTYDLETLKDVGLINDNWNKNQSMKSRLEELKKENEQLKRINKKINEENKRLTEETERKTFEDKRKAQAFDKICKLLYGKFICNLNYQDIYGGGKHGPIKVGRWLEGYTLKAPKLTNKEAIKLLNLLLMGINSDYYIQLNGYTGLDEENESGE